MSSVDVIVPCYRYGHFLKQCVESVLAQAGIDVRVLVIDDASPDNTPAVATDLAGKDSRVIYLRHPANKGHIATYNEGIDWACADYLMLLSADDYLLPGALARATTLMDAHPEVGFTFGNAITLDEHGTFSYAQAASAKTGTRILSGIEFIQLSAARNIVPTPTAVVRTRLQQKLGGYRPELPHCGDMEMWLRLAAHAAVGKSEAYEAVYRRHAGNMSLNYSAATLLPDLQQRKAALDCFLATCGAALPNPSVLGQMMISSLSRDTLDHANTAFNESKEAVSHQLAAYALELHPEIKESALWRKLAYKRAMGYATWLVLQQAVCGARRVKASLVQLVNRTR